MRHGPSDRGLPHSHETHEIEIEIGCAHEAKRWCARAGGAIADLAGLRPSPTRDGNWKTEECFPCEEIHRSGFSCKDTKEMHLLTAN
jgi:hypothetical protein